MDTAVRANEMIWRFAHEDGQDNRIVISKHRRFESVAGRSAEILLEEVIEDWADNERGSWEHGDMLHVIVVAPDSMAGRYKFSMSSRAVAVCYPEDES